MLSANKELQWDAAIEKYAAKLRAGIAEPFVASRSEEAVVQDLTQTREAVERGQRLEGAVKRVTEAIDRIPPVLLRVVAQETGQDARAKRPDPEVQRDEPAVGRR